MERTILRLATVGALLNGGQGPPWPTIGEAFIYDSMIDDVTDVVPSRRKPVAIVRTDEDQNVYNGRTLAGRRCRLLIEIGVLTAATVKIGGVDQAKIDYPRTDSALEAFLDLFEWQVRVALGGAGEWAQWWKGFGYSVIDFASVPRFSPPERGAVRLAVRNLQFLLNINFECIAGPIKEFSIGSDRVYLPRRWIDFVAMVEQCGTGAFLKSVQETARIINTYGPIPVPAYPPLHRIYAHLPEGDGIEARWKIEQEAPFVAEPLATPDANITTPAAGTNGGL